MLINDYLWRGGRERADNLLAAVGDGIIKTRV